MRPHHPAIATCPSTNPATTAFRLSGAAIAGNQATRAVTVCPISEAAQALFVDAETGSDARGDGSPLRPFASLAGALRAAASLGQPEIYIATQAA